uniref:Uncharacterized protein n=1 Tax=Lygus hesperus TaxID=30085 RepID=A0A146KNG2_LYGHE
MSPFSTAGIVLLRLSFFILQRTFLPQQWCEDECPGRLKKRLTTLIFDKNRSRFHQFTEDSGSAADTCVDKFYRFFPDGKSPALAEDLLSTIVVFLCTKLTGMKL